VIGPASADIPQRPFDEIASVRPHDEVTD